MGSNPHIHPRPTQNDVYRRFYFFSCCSGTFICVFIEQPINFENKKLYIFFQLRFSNQNWNWARLQWTSERFLCMLKNCEAEYEWPGLGWIHTQTHTMQRGKAFNIRDFQSICQLEKRQMEIKKIASTIWLGFAVLLTHIRIHARTNGNGIGCWRMKYRHVYYLFRYDLYMITVCVCKFKCQIYGWV